MYKLLTFIVVSFILFGCAAVTSNGTTFTLLTNQKQTTINKDNSQVIIERQVAETPVKIIASTTLGIWKNSIIGPVVVAGADSIGNAIGSTIKKTGDTVNGTVSGAGSDIATDYSLETKSYKAIPLPNDKK